MAVTGKTISLALDFHENSKKIIVSERYETRQQYKFYQGTESIPLAGDIDSDSKDSFLRTIMTRKSTRSFSDKNIDYVVLSKLLKLSLGLRSDIENPDTRTYASAGGCYPIEVYLIVLRSDDLACGAYHYNVKDDTLELLRRKCYLDEINHFYSNQKDIITTDFPCLILFSMIAKRTMEKYNERGYRFILIDAGHMGQNLYLCATYLRLGVVALGAGADCDSKLDGLLALNKHTENIFYGFALGHPLT